MKTCSWARYKRSTSNRPICRIALEYAVLCQLVLDEEGYVLSYKLLNSSGSEVFDRSAQQALSRLRQVRPPPEGMSRTVVVKFFPP